jgi:hypothetical protein
VRYRKASNLHRPGDDSTLNPRGPPVVAKCFCDVLFIYYLDIVPQCTGDACFSRKNKLNSSGGRTLRQHKSTLLPNMRVPEERANIIHHTHTSTLSIAHTHAMLLFKLPECDAINCSQRGIIQFRRWQLCSCVRGTSCTGDISSSNDKPSMVQWITRVGFTELNMRAVFTLL